MKFNFNDEEYERINEQNIKRFENDTNNFIELVEKKLESTEIELIKNLIKSEKYNVAFMVWVELEKQLDIKLNEKEENIINIWYSHIGR